MDLAIVRIIFVLVLTSSAYFLHPFNLSSEVSAAGGLLLGGCIIFFEIRLEHVSLKRLIGAAVGSVLGIVGAFVMSLVVGKATPEPFLQLSILLLMSYIGLIVGAKKGDLLNLAALGHLRRREGVEEELQDLDNSVTSTDASRISPRRA
jgi:uncharacterized protein YacL